MNNQESEIKQLNNKLSEYGAKLSRLVRDYSDILSNIDDDNLSATLLNQKSKFQKLYNSFDVSDNGYTFRGDLKTNSKNERVGTSVIDTQIKIYGDSDRFEEIFLGISDEGTPMFCLGNEAQNSDDLINGMFTIEKLNTHNSTSVIIVYKTRTGEENAIIMNDNGIILGANQIDFDCNTISFENVDNIVGLPVQESDNGDNTVNGDQP